MRQRRSRYPYRRRRGPRRSTVAGIVVLAAAVAAGAAVILGTAGGAGSSSGNATAATTPAHHHSADSRRRRARRQSLGPQERAETRAIQRTLRYTGFVTAGTRGRRVIALSFDDGPGPYTPAIIRILVRMHVPATFFVVGQELKDFSAAVRSEVRHGFDIGDHTQNHAWLAHLSAAGQWAQISLVIGELQRLGAPPPRLFRPPYGAFNAQTLGMLRRLGMFMVLWSIDPGDWRRPGAKAIVSNVLANSRPGAVVIMHDGGGDRSQTVAALPSVINGLRRRHYGLVTVPRLLALDPPPRHQVPPRLSGV